MSALADLQAKLKEMFQLDRSDLDFGIYRIMNLKNKEVSEFIDIDLPLQIKQYIKDYSTIDNDFLQQELDNTIKALKDAGINPEEAPKVKELREKLGNSNYSQSIEEQIYSDLYNFFKRYYSEGDFLSLRRYKEGVYALPYEGEEVKLYWANADQYYIKSAENFTNYTFKVANKKVCFEVIEATTEQNNNKDDQNRKFRLIKDNPVRVEKGEYIISFSYLPDPSKIKQKALNEEAEQKLLKDPVLSEISGELSIKQIVGEKDISLLLKYLNTFTDKNKFDYFIHKDLGKFLRRELDFYIKNEVMHLDDIENDSAPKVEQYLNKIKILRKVANKIITFLASLENFQKKLWLKKKFVLETNYCITLDRVPEELYEEISQNDAQCEEWVKLFAINEIEQDTTHVGYSVPLTTQFLKENPFLVLDTAFFSTEFKYKLLAHIDDLDKNCDGLLIHSENFQALNLLQEKYREKVQCIYIDPPYNTELDRAQGKFIYKDGYSDASWLSLMNDRIIKCKNYLDDEGAIFISIDEHEHTKLKELCDSIFGKHNFISSFVWQKKSGGGQAKYFYEGHEYILIYAKDKMKLIPFLKNKKMSLDNSKIKQLDGKYYYMEDDFLRKVHGKYKGGEERRCYYEDIISIKGQEKKDEIDNGLKTGLYDLFLDKKSGKHFVRRKTELFRINDTFYKKTLPYSIIQEIWNSEGTETLDNILGKHIFDNPKPVALVSEIIDYMIQKNSNVLDFFAGSGTTAHSVINLNSHHLGENKKYIAVEMGKYFNTVAKPRIEKIIYSEDWKNGNPVSRKGSSHCFKYIRLESYEDTLDNLAFTRSTKQEEMFKEYKDIKEEYILNYMMDLETQDSLLNIKKFEHPFDYQIKITRDGETKVAKADLVETFNYLIGLEVKHLSHYQTINGNKKQNGIITIEGKTRSGENTLVIWRDCSEVSSDDLDIWFEKHAYNSKDSEFDAIYINGDNNIENLRGIDQSWKVRLIEDDFLKKMFDIKGI